MSHRSDQVVRDVNQEVLDHARAIHQLPAHQQPDVADHDAIRRGAMERASAARERAEAALIRAQAGLARAQAGETRVELLARTPTP